MREEEQLPKGWLRIQLKDISLPKLNVNPQDDPDAKFSYIDISSLDNLTFEITQPKLFLGKDAPSRARQKVKIGDTIFSTVRTNLKNIAFVDEEFDGSIASTGFAIIRPSSFINNKLVFYYCISDHFVEIVSFKQTGASYPAIKSSEFFKQQIPLPPLAEQNRIVAKLDAVFAKLREVEFALEEVPGLLEEQKQSILYHAMSGQLSKEWRVENQSIETVADFLKKLKKKRKKSYQKAVEYAKENDLKKPKKDYEFEFQAHPKMKNWASATLDQLVYISARIGWKGLKAEEYTQEGPLFLSVHSLNYGEEVRFDKAYHISQERYEESPEIMLEEDDILLCKDGAGIGKIGIVKNLEGDATVNSSLLVVRSLEAFIPKFLFYFLSGPTLQEIVQSRITGSAIPHLFQRDIKQFVLSVPPLEEQEFIVEKIEELFDVVNDLELVYKNSIKQVDRIKKALLNQAFQGELVAQNPNDEPASLLLEKIKVEKARMEEELKVKRKARRVQPKKKRIMKNLEIIEVLKINGQPMKAHEVWKESKFRNDIDEFYAELRRVVEDTRNVEQEVRNDKETYLSLAE